MNVDTNELRRKVNSTDIVDHIDLHANIKPFLSELLDRLETAEKNLSCCQAEREEAAALFLSIKTRLTEERDALRAKIERMERQEPVGKFIRHPSNGLWEQDGYGDNPDARPLYALPGAQTQREEK